MGNSGGKDPIASPHDIVEEIQEQMNELRKNKVPLSTPWRNVEADLFSQNTKDRLLPKFRALNPADPCVAINLIVIGIQGSGKSSLVNTLLTVLRDSGQLSTIAATYDISSISINNRLHEVTLMTFQGDKKLRIYDCRGCDLNEENQQHYQNDIIDTIDGHIKKDYEFQQNADIQIDSPHYRQDPTISDRIHCVLFVMKADLIREENNNFLKRVRSHIADKKIPLRLVLTSVDKLDLCGSGDLSGIFLSRHVNIKVDLAKQTFGLNDCQILPVVNYVKGNTQNITQDVLALTAIDSILEEALSYISEQV